MTDKPGGFYCKMKGNEEEISQRSPGTCCPPKRLWKLMKSRVKELEAGDISLLQFAVEVNDNSEEEGRQGKKRIGKHVEDTMLRG